ncbi:hypothetical protein DH2020_034276 [Rehmannia glutinosa]|uniref:Beta-lactamase-related domain-containing protein n=1 Tax=Rehmannia glutinosa TaxID=99300 RepID=A0ABR0VD31_REHGL
MNGAKKHQKELDFNHEAGLCILCVYNDILVASCNALLKFPCEQGSPHRPILLDFGLTKGLSSSMKHALAKMFLASAEVPVKIPTFSSIPIVEDLALAFIMKDSRIHVVITWHFYLPSQKMGLKLRLDIPEQVMEIANVFFLNSTLQMKLNKGKNLKVLQEKMKLNEKEVKRFNPVDAFPGDIIIFSRVINLLRGLSSTMDVRVVYLDIMRPFAESVLQWAAFNANWIHDTPVLSNVEDKLRKLLIELGNADKVLGIQVCAYKDGEVIIDTAAGVLGRYDPRPVQPDSLFPVFLYQKEFTAGMVHWLVIKGKLKLEDRVASVWPEFGSNGKDQIKVHHVLNHTSGLHNALASLTRENPLLMTDWDQCLNCLTEMAPETEPGREQLYHYLSFGWLCGGIIEHASRKKFQEILEEALITPLNLDGELYIGIPPGMFSALCELAFCSLTFSTRVESRLATLTSDMDDIKKLSEISKRPDIPSSFQFQLQDISQMASTLPALFNTLHARRSIIPAANAHCSARALARYYAALVDRGSHPHIPKFSSPKSTKKQKKSKNAARNTESLVDGKNYTRVPSEDNAVAKGGFGNGQSNAKLFTNGKIHDAFMGIGEYEFDTPRWGFGLGFKRSYSENGELIGFGHSGMGGSAGYCDINHRFAIAVTLNKMNMGGVTAKIMQLVCSELNIPLPADFYRFFFFLSKRFLQIYREANR